MTTELATQANDTGAELAPQSAPSTQALEALQQQVEAMGAAHKLATVLSNTGMVPQIYRGKPDDAAAAILYGSEVGLAPQQALQQVFVVHGQPAIYARTMVGLLKARGFRFETIESTDEQVTVKATSPRGETEIATWNIARAKKAGYTSNKKYNTDPQAMLYSKAASEVCRKIAPDVLLGIRYSAEDLELEQPVKATAERIDTPRDVTAVVDNAVDSNEHIAAEQDRPAAPDVDIDATLAMIRSAQGLDDLDSMRDFVQEHVNAVPADREQINAVWTETEAALQ